MGDYTGDICKIPSPHGCTRHLDVISRRGALQILAPSLPVLVDFETIIPLLEGRVNARCDGYLLRPGTGALRLRRDGKRSFRGPASNHHPFRERPAKTEHISRRQSADESRNFVPLLPQNISPDLL